VALSETQGQVGYYVIGSEYTKGCYTVHGGLLKIMTHDCSSNVSIWERPTDSNNNIYFRNRLTGQLLSDHGGWTASLVNTDDSRSRWNFGYRHGIFAWIRNVATGRYLQWTTGPSIILTPVNSGWNNHFRIFRMTTNPPPLQPKPVGLPAPKPLIVISARPSMKRAPTICAFPTNYHYIIKSIPANKCLKRGKRGVHLAPCNLNIGTIWKIFRAPGGRFVIRGRRPTHWLGWRRPTRRRKGVFHLRPRKGHRFGIPSLASGNVYNYTPIQRRGKCLNYNSGHISWTRCSPVVSQQWILVRIVVNLADVANNSTKNAVKLADDKLRKCVQNNQGN